MFLMESKFEAKLVENGILYEFVEPQKEFYDFSEDILSGSVAKFENQTRPL
jgi:hypothetical protein